VVFVFALEVLYFSDGALDVFNVLFIRSIVAGDQIKRTELSVLLETIQPDVIIGTETWLTKDIGNGEFFPGELGFDVICKNRCRQDRELTHCSEHLSMMTLYPEHLR
jgi:hypothetical protein